MYAQEANLGLRLADQPLPCFFWDMECRANNWIRRHLVPTWCHEAGTKHWQVWRSFATGRHHRLHTLDRAHQPDWKGWSRNSDKLHEQLLQPDHRHGALLSRRCDALCWRFCDMRFPTQGRRLEFARSWSCKSNSCRSRMCQSIELSAGWAFIERKPVTLPILVTDDSPSFIPGLWMQFRRN